MFLLLGKKKSTPVFVAPILFLLLVTCVDSVRAQRSGSGAANQARAIQRADLDRILVLAAPAAAPPNSIRAEVMKQVRMDFRELQELNNKMMATAWGHEALDYYLLSDMVSRIKAKANRLKTNLQLPTAGDLDKPVSAPNVSNTGEFCAALLVLDETIMRFVNNPLFQTPHTLEVDLAAKARSDLEAVISLSTGLKKTATRLSKFAPAH
ncbi:MAG TPA: hypothetical protein VGO56_11960 [Pyrinomonadaceae bacterium]|jgi:hypothetical protein|nr:hypothetical protein [Pyrinomonadaceae bacterium]